jgi:NAD+ kinase
VPARWRTWAPRWPPWRREMTPRAVTVITHRRVAETAPALRELVVAAREAGATLRFSPDEAAKHSLTAGDGLEVREMGHDVDLCIVLGGDGTILTALRHYAGTGVPVFAVNYGEVGFLATIDPDALGSDFARAFRGEFDTLELPTITVGRPEGEWTAINDISVHRKPGFRVADLAYALAGEEIGRVRCDGLVVSTPQGSTGYNLANGGPVLAWGVEGFVVSFIAPHSLTARALVVAPDDQLTIHNASREEPVEIHIDGRPVTELQAGEDLHVEYAREQGVLAQLPGASFYHRLRDRFGRLAR